MKDFKLETGLSNTEIIGLFNLLLSEQELQGENRSIEIDNIATELSMVKLRLNMYEFKKVTAVNFSEEYEIIDKILDDLRNTTRELYPYLIKFVGLLKDLGDVADRKNRASKTRFELNNEIPESYEIPREKGIFIHRIFSDMLSYLCELKKSKVNIGISFANDLFYLEFTSQGDATVDNRKLGKKLSLVKTRLLCAQAIVSGETNWDTYMKFGFKLS